MYTVSKLLLNSLYGRLGMSPFVENHTVVENEKSNELLLNENYTITNVVDLNNGKELIAYARIKMSQIKMDKKNLQFFWELIEWWWFK
jgi:hypothetical protein